MLQRHRGARIALVALFAVLLAAPGRPTPRAGAQETPTRYIVTLDAPPLSVEAAPFAVQAVEAQRGEALSALGAVLGAPVEPIYVYRHALNGFAVALTPKQAAMVAAMPGVARVSPETFSTYQTDRGPSLIGTADRSQRPALFFTPLAGAPGATGQVVASYDAAAKRLQLQVGYSGLGGAPTLAELRLGAAGEAGALVESLTTYAVGTPGGSGAYGGLLAPLDADGEAALFAGRLFVRLDGPAGSIRGQLRPGGGEGVVVAMLDGGINVGHPFFQDPAPNGYNHTNPRGAGNYLGVCNPSDGDGRYDATFPCNDKLIGAYTFAETADFPDPQGRPSPRDDDGHGSHTASTVAGNVLTGVPGGTLAGVAPHASLIIYDVCGTAAGASSCSSLGIVAAIDQAIADKVDVISYSIGRATTSPWGNEVAQAYLSAVTAGIVVAAAAGNAGPGDGTIGSPANAPWVLGVAASSLDRSFANTLAGFSGGSAATRPTTLTGGGVAPPLAAATTLVDAAALSPANAACAAFSTTQAAQVAGKIVVCDDLFGFASAAANVWEAGAAGAIFVAGAFAGSTLPQIIFTRPALLLSEANGAVLRQWLTGCVGCKATIMGATQVLDRPADVIAGFSSRGPDLRVPTVIKPDVAAPGAAILAASADFDPAATDFEIISGTSMATPHASGMAAILRQMHPDWTPSELKSAMMLTAEPSMQKEDGTTAADPFDKGAGRIRGAAALAGFVLDERGAAYSAADPATGGDPSQLNLASIATDECLGVCTFTRTLRSTLGTTVTWTIGREDGDGFTLSTSPAGSITLGPGEQRTLVVTATATAAISATYGFGRLTLTPPAGIAPPAGLPVAIRTLRSTLNDPLEIAAVEPVGSTKVPVRSLEASGLTGGAYGLVRLNAQTLSLPEDLTPGNLDDPGGIYTREVTLPPGTTRLRVQIRKAQAPDMDLYILADTDGDGAKESLCAGVSISNVERCDILAADLVRGSTAALKVTILVQNFQGSGAVTDQVELLYGFVGTTSTGNLAVGTPGTVSAGVAYDLDLAYTLTRPRPGEIYIGVLTLSSTASAADRGDLGAVPVTLQYVAHRLSLPVVGR